jgi:hypothetical protein
VAGLGSSPRSVAPFASLGGCTSGTGTLDVISHDAYECRKSWNCSPPSAWREAAFTACAFVDVADLIGRDWILAPDTPEQVTAVDAVRANSRATTTCSASRLHRGLSRSPEHDGSAVSLQPVNSGTGDQVSSEFEWDWVLHSLE